MQQVLQEHRTYMQQELSTIPNINFYLPDGAYYFFPDFSAYMASIAPSGQIIDSSISLFNYLSQTCGVTLSPGDNFGAPGYARMSFAVEKPVLAEGLQRLKEGLARLQTS